MAQSYSNVFILFYKLHNFSIGPCGETLRLALGEKTKYSRDQKAYRLVLQFNKIENKLKYLGAIS